MSWTLQKKKEGIFCIVYFIWRKFFKICVLSQCIVYWIQFQNVHTFTYQKTHFCCLLLKRKKDWNWLLKYAQQRKCFHYVAWEFLLDGIWDTPRSLTVSTVKYFQRFKILQYFQNTAYMSFRLFTHYIYRFSISFSKYQISFSSLGKSFCVSTFLEPYHCVPKYCDMWHLTKWQYFFVFIWWRKN